MKGHAGKCIIRTPLPRRCTCGHCSVMNTEKESICCREVEQLTRLLGSESEHSSESLPRCITRHTDFINVCLCRAVLTVALHSHRHRYGTDDVPEDENRYY